MHSWIRVQHYHNRQFYKVLGISKPQYTNFSFLNKYLFTAKLAEKHSDAISIYTNRSLQKSSPYLFCHHPDEKDVLIIYQAEKDQKSIWATPYSIFMHQLVFDAKMKQLVPRFSFVEPNRKKI